MSEDHDQVAKKDQGPDFTQKIPLNQKDKINTSDFTLSKKLGAERLLYYFEVEEVKTGKIYFAKILRRNKEKYQEKNYELFEKNMINEVNFLRQIDYPSIIKYIGYSPNGIDQKHQPAIVLEYGRKGRLSNIIHATQDQIKHLGWDDTKKLINIFGIASAISYLHSFNVLHRNLNTNNIFENDDLYPLVANLENALCLDKDEEKCTESFIIGSIQFLSPEIISKKEYSRKSDIYAFGMIVYEIMTGLAPFADIQDSKDISNNISQGIKPEMNDQIPESYKELYKACCSKEPEDRLNIDDILEDLRNNKGFITPEINLIEYKTYISNIENYFLNKTVQKSNESRKEEEFFIGGGTCQRKSRLRAIKTINLKNPKLVSQENFYDVFEVENNKTHQNLIAKSFYVPLEYYSLEEKNKIDENISRILEADHPSILKSIDFSDYGFGREYRPTVVTEFNKNISLRDVITKSELSSQFNATKKLINIYGIACGMSYLHSHNILHLELTPFNIIEDSNFYPKIKDFGIHANFESLKTLTKTYEISPYLSPESYTNNEYTQKSEVYSFGMIVYAIMTNELPFDQITNIEYMNNVEHQIRPSFDKYQEKIPTPYQELISRCWNNDPKLRPTFPEIKEELETDPKYITPEVDSNEYGNYTKTIKESEAKHKSQETDTNNTNDGSSTQGNKKEPRGKKETEPKKAPNKPPSKHEDDDDDPHPRKPGPPGGLPSGGLPPDGNGGGGGGKKEEEEDDDYYDEEEEEDTYEKRIWKLKKNEMPSIPEEQIISLINYLKGDTLGNGGTSIVVEAIHYMDQSIKYAAKIFVPNMDNVISGLTYSEYIEMLKKNIRREVENHLMISGPNMKLRHPSITNSIGFAIKRFRNSPNHNPVLLLELMSYGTLRDVIDRLIKKREEEKDRKDEKEEKDRKDDRWNETTRLICIYGIASTMAYLHAKGIIHRDLKLENILVDQYLYPKLADFGLSIKTSEADNEKHTIGTERYMAPEIFRENEYSVKSDVYAFGILVYELMMEEIFKVKGKFIYCIAYNKERPQIPDTIPECYKNLITSCWDDDPEKRPTFMDILQILKTDDFAKAQNIDNDLYQNYIQHYTVHVVGEK